MKAWIKNLVFRTFYFFLRVYYRDKVIFLDCRPHQRNFGDAFNLWLVAKLSGNKAVRIQSEYFNGRHMMAAGSILDHARETTLVWGSGLISNDIHFHGVLNNVRAVRGRLTQKRLLEKGIPCPSVFGDPAILVPRLYKPQCNRKGGKFKIGIIPHYVDKTHSWLQPFLKQSDIHVIDIQQESIFGFIDDVCNCEIILSSSLHGLIIADAYGIPNVWIKLSEKVIGGDFKFMDYYSISSRLPHCVAVIGDEDVFEISSLAEVTIFETDFSELLESFPFKKNLK
jgi:pyruvyltransferase